MIDKNPLVWAAFRFANRAMYLQRQHATLARKVRKKELTAEQALAAEPDCRSQCVAAKKPWRQTRPSGHTLAINFLPMVR